MKRYLITGGTGMVGSHLVNEIKQTDAHITILTRQDKTSKSQNHVYQLVKRGLATSSTRYRYCY